ncbi:MAG: hypothetical protein M5R36_04720 [Deltaproteobacteria bacterium]|nr:hypothetical protein [Deltaproteobacteria bacterium]
MGNDLDANLSFVDGHFAVSLEKADVMETVEQFLVDSYCANDDCNGGSVLMPQNGCSPAANGDTAACTGETLEFGDIPSQCDTEIGTLFKVPVRLIRVLVDMLPNNFVINFQVSGWGHEMTFSNDFSGDWNIGEDVFDNAYCPSTD